MEMETETLTDETMKMQEPGCEIQRLKPDDIIDFQYNGKPANILNTSCLSNRKNYGQRLQSYALQKYIKNTFGMDVAIADYRDGFNPFEEFEKKYMNIVNGKHLPIDGLNQFDVVLIGSDQVFTSANVAKKYFRDEFVGRLKTCTYAASANGSLSKNDNDLSRKLNYLKRCKLVGLREQIDAEVARKNNVADEVVCNIDPIFLLTVEQWKEIAKRPSCIQPGEVFDFTYKLGKKYDKVVEDPLTGIKNYIVYGNTDKIDKQNFQPDEFLWMLLNCRNFTTTSFHGNVFGIIFGKDMSFPNERAFSVVNKWHGTMRIDNILELIGAKIENGKIINQNEIFENIAKQRELAREWLEKCLSCSGFKYACYAKDTVIRDKSSSGGMSALLAKHFIDNAGVVYGAAYSDDFRSVKTVRVDNMKDYFMRISKSKYSFCQMPDIEEVRKDLESGKQVLFTGCPCQIVKLKQELVKEYENLTTVDLLCNGYSRPEFLKEFVEKQEQEEGSRIVSMDMRTSHGFNIHIKFENGKVKDIPNVTTKVFVCNKANYIEDCKTCNMHTPGNSHADLTIGDFWGYKKYTNICNQDFDPKIGSSIVYVNTESGRKLFNTLKHQLEWRYLQ